MAKLKFAVRGLLSVALLLWVVRKVNWPDLGLILGRINWPWAALAFLLGGTLIVGLALRWQIFLHQQQITLPFGTILSLTWAGQFFNSFLPGSTGGDIFKAYQICRLNSDRKAAAVASVLGDRLSALLALLVFATIAFFLESAPLREVTGAKIAAINIWWLVVIVAVATSALVIAGRAMICRTWLGLLRQVLTSVFENARPNSAIAVLLAFGIHSVNFLVIYLLGKSLGLTATFGQILLIMPVVLLFVMLPITINGHGLREVLLIAYFTQLGVHVGQSSAIAYQDVAIALSLLMVVTDLLWSLPGGLQYLVRFRAVKEPQVLANATC